MQGKVERLAAAAPNGGMARCGPTALSRPYRRLSSAAALRRFYAAAIRPDSERIHRTQAPHTHHVPERLQAMGDPRLDVVPARAS